LGQSSVDLIHKAFKYCGISNLTGGSEDGFIHVFKDEVLALLKNQMDCLNCIEKNCELDICIEEGKILMVAMIL